MSEIWLSVVMLFGLGETLAELLLVELIEFWGFITEFINCWEPLNRWWKFGFDFSLRNVWLQLNASTSWFISLRSVIQRVIWKIVEKKFRWFLKTYLSADLVIQTIVSFQIYIQKIVAFILQISQFRQESIHCICNVFWRKKLKIDIRDRPDRPLN